MTEGRKALDAWFGGMPNRAVGEVIESDGRVILLVRWALTGIGFGELTFVRRTDGTWSVDEEAMGPHSIARILRLLVEKTPT